MNNYDYGGLLPCELEMLLALNKHTHVLFDPSLLLIETLSAGYYL